MTVSTSYSWQLVQNLDITQGLAAFRPSVTSLASGGFAAAGDDEVTTAVDLFNAAGADIGGAVIDSSNVAAMDQLTNGNLAVVTIEPALGIFSLSILDSVTATRVEFNFGVIDFNADADIAALAGGGCWVVTSTESQMDTAEPITVFRYGNDGSLAGTFSVDSPGNLTYQHARVIGLEGGNVAIAWTVVGAANSTQIWLAIYGPDGTEVKAPFAADGVGLVNRNVSMTPLAGGGFALVYEDDGGGAGGIDVTLEILNASGALQLHRTYVNDFSADLDPSVTQLSNGMLAISYSDNTFGQADTDTIVHLVDAVTGNILASRGVTGGANAGFDTENSVLTGFGGGRVAVFHASLTDFDIDGEDLQAARTMTSDAAGDTMIGDGIADIMYGGGGGDTMFGGSGADMLDGGSGNDRLDGGAGVDTVSYVDAASALYIDLRVATQANTGGLGTDVISTIENVIGGAFADTLIGNAGVNTLYGGAGADALVTVEGDDFAYGGAGDDYVAGRDGNDTLYGGLDRDVMDGGNGLDMLRGNEGDDYLIGGADADTIYGGDGVTNVGDLGDRWLGGDGGDDLIYGNLGTDRLSGGMGRDVLTGGEGFDYMTGEAGADTFVYNAVSDGSISEQIGDWQGSVDLLRIDASAFGGGLAAGPLAANRLVIGTSANQAFGQFLYNAGNGVLYWDADGTGAGSASAFTRLFTSAFTLPPATIAVTDFDVVV